jgi:hypothetical protein
MKLRLALGLSVMGAAAAVFGGETAEAADPPQVCDRFKGQFDRGDWNTGTVRELRALERGLPLACGDLRSRVNARIESLERARTRDEPSPTRCPPSDWYEPVLAGTDPEAVRRLRDNTREDCARVYRLAVDWLNRRGGRATLTQLIFNDPRAADISSADPLLQNMHFDQYRMRLRPGDRIALTMRSEAFPPLLAVVTGTPPDDFRVLDYEDYQEFEGGVRLVFTAPASEEGDAAAGQGALPEAQDYVVVALSREREQTGPYTIEQHGPPPPEPPRPLPTPRPVEFGVSVQSTITEDSASIRNRGSEYYYEPWGFSGTAGDRVRIYMDAEYDAFLSLGRVEGGGFVEVATNDDGGEGLDSLIFYRLEQDGDYVIRARSLGGYAGGPYTLTVDQVATEPRVRVAEVADTWLLNGALFPDETATQEFEFRPRRGRRYAVSVNASSFSPILDLGIVQRGGEVRELDFYAEAANAEPAQPGAESAAPDPEAASAEIPPQPPPRSPSRIEFRANERGAYILRVRSRDGDGGDFRVTITELD